MFVTIIIFIIILGVLVFVHEFGHFWVAKKSGMRVDEFGFGFPPRIAGIQKVDGKWKIFWGHKNNPFLNPSPQKGGETPISTAEQGQATSHSPLMRGEDGREVASDATVYSINWIPFGGFVKIRGENNENENDPRSFINRPFWARFATLVAGVSMNWILAAVLFALSFAVGITSEINTDDPMFKNATITNPQVAISLVVNGLPAAKAGIMEGDIILSVDGKEFRDVSILQDYIRNNKGETFDFQVKRINEVKNINVKSTANPPEGEGPTGIALTSIGTLKLPWYSAISLGVQKAYNLTIVIVQGFFKIFTSKEVLKSVGGPIKIAQLTGQVAALGFVPILNFAGLLSINLAILNILPIPALDGGRVLFLIIEKIRRKKNNQKIEQFVNTMGFVLLIMLMIVVTIKDIMKR